MHLSSAATYNLCDTIHICIVHNVKCTFCVTWQQTACVIPYVLFTMCSHCSAPYVSPAAGEGNLVKACCSSCLPRCQLALDLSHRLQVAPARCSTSDTWHNQCRTVMHRVRADCCQQAATTESKYPMTGATAPQTTFAAPSNQHLSTPLQSIYHVPSAFDPPTGMMYGFKPWAFSCCSINSPSLWRFRGVTDQQTWEKT